MKIGKDIFCQVLRVAAVLLAAAVAVASCENDYDDRTLMTHVTVTFRLTDGADYETIVPLSTSYLTNLNTRDGYTFGTFDGGVSTVEVQKGVYTLFVDAVVYFGDGTSRKVRNADHAQPAEALVWLDDSAELTLEMKYL